MALISCRVELKLILADTTNGGIVKRENRDGGRRSGVYLGWEDKLVCCFKLKADMLRDSILELVGFGVDRHQ